MGVMDSYSVLGTISAVIAGVDCTPSLPMWVAAMASSTVVAFPALRPGGSGADVLEVFKRCGSREPAWAFDRVSCKQDLHPACRAEGGADMLSLADR
jgi:hypothetical protein